MLRNALLIVAGLSMAVGPPQDTPVQKELARLNVPDQLVPKGKQALFLLRAEGRRVYRAEENAGKIEWVFQCPLATLLDFLTAGRVGTLTGGAENNSVWKDCEGSRLRGKVVAEHPAADGWSIPWLLIDVKCENGGRFEKVTSVQRVDTWAGNAPTLAPEKRGETRTVRYEATYVFWGDK